MGHSGMGCMVIVLTGWRTANGRVRLVLPPMYWLVHAATVLREYIEAGAAGSPV